MKMYKLRYALRCIDSINEFTGMAVRWLAMAMMAFIAYEVVSRYVFSAPTIWSTELNKLIFGSYIILIGGYVLRHDAHVSIDFVYVRLPLRARGILDLVTYLFFFFFVGMILVYGSAYAWESLIENEHSGSVWGPPLWPVKMMIPIGAALILLQGVARYIRSLYIAITGKELV